MALTDNMMSIPWLINSLLTHAVESSSDQEIVTALDDGEWHVYTYRGFGCRAIDVAVAMKQRGISTGHRVATLAWDSHRHLEIYYTTFGIGAICRTVNPRLSQTQIESIINDGQDIVVVYDWHFEELLQTPRRMAGQRPPRASSGPSSTRTPAVDLRYAPGTTGAPKGALQSHRSTVLQTYASCHPNALAISSSDADLHRSHAHDRDRQDPKDGSSLPHRNDLTDASNLISQPGELPCLSPTC